MLNSSQLIYLYSRVLEDISTQNNISEIDIKQAIKHLHKIYQASSNSLSNNFKYLTDFNEVTYRCAYLFKYAPFHTALSYKAMSHALIESPNEIRAVLDSLTRPLKLCSLGAGPGTDVIGVLAAMHNQFGLFPSSAKLVDIMSEWESTFLSVIDELRFGQQNYGSLSESVSEKWLDWSFVRADLQSEMSKELTEVLGTADIVTMTKFVSATACKETSNMIEQIFRVMKPGAFVLFVDNAAGGFEKLISNAADKYKFNHVSTPLKHQHYRNEDFNYLRYGYRSCYESKVAVQLLMKSVSISYFNENHFTDSLSYKENFSSSSDSLWHNLHLSQFENFRIGPKLLNNRMNEHQTFISKSQPNLNENNFSLLPEFPPKLARFRMQTENPVSLYKPFESESFWSYSPHNLSRKGENQNSDPEYQNEPFGHGMSSNPRFSMLHDENFLSLSPSYWQKVHVPKLQNSIVCFKSTNDPINEYDAFNHGALPVSPIRSFSSSSSFEFSSEVAATKMQTDSLANHNESLESDLTWNSPSNTSPQIFSNQNRSIRVVDQIYDERKLHLNTPLNKRQPTIQISQTVSKPILNITTTNDSGYSEESFENELFGDFPRCNKSMYFRSSPRQKYVLPSGKTDYCFHEKESISNTSKSNLAQHFSPTFQDENSSLSSVPYKPKKRKMMRNFRICSKRTKDSRNRYSACNYGSLSVSPFRSFLSSSSEFSSEVAAIKMQTDSFANHNESFESDLTWNSPSNTSPQIFSNQNRSLRVVDQIYDSVYENNLFEGNLHSNEPLNNRLLASQISETVSKPKLNVTGIDYSGYSKESFEYESLLDSPVYNKSLYFKSSPKQSRYVFLEDKTDLPFQKKKSLTNNLEQHCIMPPEEIVLLSPVLYRSNMHQRNQSANLVFEKHNLFFNKNPLDAESTYYQSWNDDNHLFKNLPHLGKYIGSKEQSRTMHQSKSNEPKRSNKKESKDNLLSLELPHQHQKRFKTQKKHCNVSVHRHKPYKTKRSATKRSKQTRLKNSNASKRRKDFFASAKIK